MELKEALEILKNEGLIVEDSASLEDKIANAKNFNAPKIDKKIVVDAFNAIKSMAGKGGFEYNEDALDNYFTAKEITDGTLEQVMKRNKGFYTVMIEVRKTLNDFGNFVEIELVITPQGNIEVLVKENQRIKRTDVSVKRFDVTEYRTAIKYAKWVK